MTISGHPEIGLEDVPWTLAAHRIDVLRLMGATAATALLRSAMLV